MTNRLSLVATKLLVVTLLFIALAINVSAGEGSSVGTDGLVSRYSYDFNGVDDFGVYNGTVTGATYQTSNCFVGDGCYNFDGNDHIESLPILGGEEYSFFIWVKPDNCSLGNTNVLSSFYNSSMSNERLRLYYQSSGTITGQSDYSFGRDASISCETGWHMVGVVCNYTATDCTIYHNATGSTDTTSNQDIGMEVMRIGRDGYGANYFHGDVDEVTLWNRALSPTEVSNLFTDYVNGITPQNISTLDAKTLYINNTHPNCISYPSRTENSQEVPYCDITDYFENITSGDLGLAVGEYNSPYSGYTIDDENFAELTSLKNVPLTDFTISATWLDYENLSKSPWTNVSARAGGRNVWNDSFASSSTTLLAWFEDTNISFYTAPQVGFIFNDSIENVMYWDNTNDYILIKLSNPSVNPNNIPIGLSRSVSAFAVDNVINFELANTSIKSGVKGIYQVNSSEITYDGLSIVNGLKAVDIRSSHNTKVKKSTISRLSGDDWLWNEMKGSPNEETTVVWLENDYEGMNITQNEVFGAFNGILQNSNNNLYFELSEISHNVIYDFRDDAIEYESKHNGGWCKYNNVSNTYSAISFVPFNSSGNVMQIEYNILVANRSVHITGSTWYTGSCFKATYGGSAGVTVNANISHITCYGRGSYTAGDSHNFYNLTIMNSIFYSESSRVCDYCGLRADGVIYDYNLYYRNDGSYLFRGYNVDNNSEYTSMANAFNSATNVTDWNTMSINADPLFVNKSGFNFAIYNTSPAYLTASDGLNMGAIQGGETSPEVNEGVSINFTSPTPSNGSTLSQTHINVNVTSDGASTNVSTFIDFDNSVVFWYRGGEDGYVDNSSYASTLTNFGTVIQGSGRIGNSTYCDGSTNFTSDSSALDINGNISIMFWFNPDVSATTSWQRIIAMPLGFSNPVVIAYRAQTNELIASRNASTDNTWANNTITEGEWQHIGVVYGNDNSLRMYIDGEEVNYYTKGDNAGISSGNTSFCARQNGISQTTGSIDDIVILNRSISQEEIQAHMGKTTSNSYSINMSGLADGNHNFQAYAQNTDGLINTTGTRIINLDISLGGNHSPIITGLDNYSVTNTTANIVWVKDRASNSTLCYGIGNYNTCIYNTSMLTSTTVSLEGLLNFTDYIYNATSCVHAENGGNCSSENKSFRTLQHPYQYNGINVPIISGLGVIPTNISLTPFYDTDISSNDTICFGLTITNNCSYSSVLNTTHGRYIDGLINSTYYNISIKSCVGSEGGINCSSSNFTIETEAILLQYNGANKPVISLATNLSTTNISSIITATTDISSNDTICFGTTATTNCTYNSSLTILHRRFLDGLTNLTSYNVSIQSCVNSQAGENCTSTNFTFRTSEILLQINGNASASISNIAVSPANTSSIITWTTDKDTNSSFCYGAGYGTCLFNTSLKQVHGYKITGLSFNITYPYRIRVYVPAENGGNLTDSTNSFTTTNTTQYNGAVRPIIYNLSDYSNTNNSAILRFNAVPDGNASICFGTVDYSNCTYNTSNNIFSRFIDGLLNYTTYIYNVSTCALSEFSGGNCSESIGSFTTLQNPYQYNGNHSPIISNLNSVEKNNNSLISWNTDKDANTTVCWNTSCFFNVTLTQSHAYFISGLVNGSYYNLSVSSGVWSEGGGNVTTETSQIATTTSEDNPPITGQSNNILPLILAIGMVAFLIIFFVFQWEHKEHFLLILLGSFVFVTLLVLISNVTLEANNSCSLVVTSTTTVGDNVTNHYNYVCVENTSSSALTFFKITMWFLRLFFLYLFMYYNWVMWIKRKMLDLGMIKGRNK